MKTWESRPVEIAHLLNPAFCGEVIRRAVRRHNETAQRLFPYPLTFLVLPIVLHKWTRESISPNTREQMHVWLQAHQETRAGFADRAGQMVPYTKEALNFLFQVNAFGVNDSGELGLVRGQQRRVEGQENGEIADCYRKAEIVGRWFARAGSTANIYTMWGVKP